MRCEKVRDVLLTDYIDRRLPEAMKAAVDEHCLSCVSCRAVAQSVVETSERLRASGNLEAPERVWQGISEALGTRVPLRERMFEWLRGFLGAHRPAFAVSTVVTVLLVSALAVRIPVYRNQRMVNGYLEEQAQLYLGSNGDAAFVDSVTDGAGTTPIFF